MKVFDLHIGLSDSIVQLKKDPNILGSPNDEFPNQFDYIRAKVGKLDTFCGMICPIEIDGERMSLPENQIEELNKHMKFFETEEKEGRLRIVKAKNDLAQNGLKVILGIEGAYFLKTSEDLGFLEELIKKGVKIIGPKWNFGTNLFNEYGSTSLGKEFLSICLQNNIIIDLAHSESDYIEIILNEYKGPVIDSHTCIFNVNPKGRNIKDEFTKEIIRRGGLIGLNFVGEFVGGNKIENVLSNFDYFIENFGVENLCIGSDFDGMEQSDLIQGLEDVSKYSNLQKALENSGLEGKNLEKIFSLNALKFFTTNL